jgi:hypothetical protein
MYKNSKQIAEDLERRAKIVSERTRQKERFSHLPYQELKELHKKTFDKYRHAGDMWVKAGKPKRAIQMYEGAIKFAPSPEIEERIEEKIKNLYVKNNRGLEKRLFAIASIVSLLGALFFTSLNLSGYVTGNLSEDASLMKMVLFVLGLIFAFAFLKKKK